MAEQRPGGFRFRLPWLLPSAPAPAPRPLPPPPPPQPTTTTTTTQAPTQSTTMTPAVRLPFRPPGVAQAQPPPPQAQVSPRTESQPSSPSRAGTQPRVSPQPASPSRVVAQSQAAPLPPSPSPSAPAPRPPQPTTTTTQAPTQTTSVTPAVRPPFRPPGVAQAQPPPPQAQVSQRTESQPSSPSRAGTQPRVSPQPASPSRVVAQSRAPPQPPSPSLAGPQPQSDSQALSPSRAPPQSQSSPSRTTLQTASQAPSPSRAALQSRVASQPSAPSRTTPQPQSTSQTASQPQSPFRLGSQPTGGAYLLPSSPSITATKVQPTTEAVTQPPPSPTKTLQPITQESSQPPPRSSEPLPPISEKEEAKPALSQPQSLQAQPNGVATQPSQESGPVATIAPTPTIATETHKLDSSTISAEPKSLAESDGIREETKERNEVQKTSGITYDESKQKIVTEASQTKEQPSAAFQAPLKQLEKQETLGTKEVLATSIPNEKQAKTVISPPKDRSLVSESHQKPAISNEQRVPLHKEIRDDISKFVHKMATGNTKHFKDEKPVSVITLAGENRGASMHLGSESTKREGAVHIHRGYKINPDDSAEATTDAEGSSKGRRSKDAITEEDRATKSYINSNIQGLNNSMLFNSSITERNPGVHLVLSHNLQEPIKSNDRTESLSRAEINITPAQKLTYEPTVRRRCLRGLLMEPSDSDTDNPEKPRRHGCLYNCGEKNKDSKIDIL